MVLITGSWRIALAGLALSAVIFGVLYFTVIKPDNNTANQAIKSGLQQTQQALSTAQQSLTTAASQAGAVNSQASQSLSKAAKLTACISAAGTDVTKVTACQAQYGH